MDRRKRKTIEAIEKAMLELLANKPLDKILMTEIAKGQILIEVHFIHTMKIHRKSLPQMLKKYRGAMDFKKNRIIFSHIYFNKTFHEIFRMTELII